VKKENCMLCKDFDDNPGYWKGKTVSIEPKLDGFRIIVIKRDGKVSIFSRSGKVVTDLPFVEKSVLECPMDNFALDGERIPRGFRDMTKDDQFRAVQRSKKHGNDNKDMIIGVYDGMPLSEWEGRAGKTPRKDRMEYIKAVCAASGDALEYVEPLYVGPFNFDMAMKIFDDETKKEKEGVVVKDLNAVYKWGRGYEQVKIKGLFDADMKVVGIEEGSGKHAGKIGSLSIEGVCRYSRHSNETVFVSCKVGTGLLDEEREFYWKHRDRLIGGTVEVLYAQVSSDADGTPSLRHPRVKCVKGVGGLMMSDRERRAA